jgi:hypothetical protein
MNPVGEGRLGVAGFKIAPDLRSSRRRVAGSFLLGESILGLYGYPRSISSLGVSGARETGGGDLQYLY